MLKELLENKIDIRMKRHSMSSRVNLAKACCIKDINKINSISE